MALNALSHAYAYDSPVTVSLAMAIKLGIVLQCQAGNHYSQNHCFISQCPTSPEFATPQFAFGCQHKHEILEAKETWLIQTSYLRYILGTSYGIRTSMIPWTSYGPHRTCGSPHVLLHGETATITITSV